MALKRGEVVLCALPGDFGKPRPAVVAQSNLFNETHASIVVCPLTTHRVDAPLFRISVPSAKRNGLAAPSQIMVDKLTAIKASRIEKKIGRLSEAQLAKLNRALKLWLDIE